MGKRHFGLPFLQKLDKLAFQNSRVLHLKMAKGWSFWDRSGWSRVFFWLILTLRTAQTWQHGSTGTVRNLVSFQWDQVDKGERMIPMTFRWQDHHFWSLMIIDDLDARSSGRFGMFETPVWAWRAWRAWCVFWGHHKPGKRSQLGEQKQPDFIRLCSCARGCNMRGSSKKWSYCEHLWNKEFQKKLTSLHIWSNTHTHINCAKMQRQLMTGMHFENCHMSPKEPCCTWHRCSMR